MKNVVRVFLILSLLLVLPVSAALAIDEGVLHDVSLDSIFSFDSIKSGIDKADVRPGFAYFPDIRDGKFVSTTGVTLFGLSYKEVEYVNFGGGYFAPEGAYIAANVPVRPLLEQIPGIRITNSIIDKLPGSPVLQASLLYGHQFSTQESGVGAGATISFDLP